MTAPKPSGVCAIIAGAGAFPLHVAQEAKRAGLTVVALGLQSWADPELARHVDVYEEVAVGQIGRLLERLQAHRAAFAIMAGKVTKEVLFDPRVAFDGEALRILQQVKEFSVNAVLGAIALRLAAAGVTLLDSSTFLQESACPVGVVTSRGPTPEERAAIEAGVRVARQIAQLDVGQTIVVKRRVIVAVEALEGTDATIRRAGELAGGGGVIIKMGSPQQDRRFDLPILGVTTLEMAQAAGMTCLAVEARATLLLDKDALIARANALGLCLIGIEVGSPPAADTSS
mgnify:CR=1 FL=1